MNQPTPLYSRIIDFLRFPLAVLIILLHNNPLGIQFAMHENDMDSYNSAPVYYLLHHLFTNNIARIAVPLFFFIPGYLFFLKFCKNSDRYTPMSYYSYKLKGTLKSVVMPYFVWNAISFLFFFFIHIFLSVYMKGDELRYADYTVWDWTKLLWYPASGHLWFLRDLFAVSVYSLPLYYILRNRLLGFCAIIALFVLWMIGSYHIFRVITIDSFLFWTGGAYLCIQQKDITVNYKKVLALSIIVYIILLPIEVWLWNTDNDAFLYLGKLLLCVGIVSAISSAATFLSARDIKVPSLLPKSSFFIYLSHALLLIIIVRLWMTIVPHTQSMLILEYFLVPIIASIILLMVYKLMSRYTPSILKLLNGGRI